MKFVKNIGKFIVSFCTHISPKFGCQVIYFMKFKKFPNLKQPKEFNEKLMWLKLNNYNSNRIVWKCADKYTMREYCIEKGIDNENFPKLLNVYNNVSEINFDELPIKFALKCTHGMGFNIICEDKNKLNYDLALKKLDKWQKKKFGYESAETHYTHIKPKIICEEFIENAKNEFPIDYKFYCFNGEPKIVLVCTDRKEHYQTIFFDLEWNKFHLRKDESKKNVSKPKSFEQMVEFARILSKDFPFVRIDFYEYQGKAIIGEMTFTPAACLGEYTKDASLMLGEMINL